ncbi:sigma-70 family RNA polymerase sigma factor [Spirochaeta africana]|uniref:RNA polymerase sigma factor, sigma-70 family n=1 Tax=Spirochaeta africana (strain ATCC 700263 / DSM 8902 / Z-7692) TaxID=889378 RepID=H9UKB2_SPIAZ|nr:RNA polymerase sigma factor RpoD/SigA [Spirochaeta africana]AFG37955.1 RNA polymerase sigma factor, sigma-70 family [Spirochaeta africana DSM 8902]
MKAKRNELDTDALQTYFAQIKQYALLTAEQEQQLSRQIMAGDEDAMQRLIQCNLRLVVKIAKAYASDSQNLMDLIQEGNIGLMKAAEKFDHRKNARFSTYASWWIRQSITRAIANKRRMIRLPHRKEDALRRIKRTALSLQQTLMRLPTTDEIAAEVGMSHEDVLEIMQFSGSTISLQAAINEDSGTLMDIVEDYSYCPDREVMREAVHQETLQLLDGLRERERRILLYRFALLGGERSTLKCIGQRMGISPETVRQIEMRALRKLQKTAEPLYSYAHA